MVELLIRVLLGEGRFAELWRHAGENPVVELHRPDRKGWIHRAFYYWTPFLIVIGAGIIPLAKPIFGAGWRSDPSELLAIYCFSLMVVIWCGALPISVFAFLLFAAKNPGRERLQELMLTPLTHEEVVFGHLYWGMRAATRTFFGVSIPLASVGLLTVFTVSMSGGGDKLENLVVALSIYAVLFALTFLAQAYALVHGARGYLREQRSPWRSLAWTPVRAAFHVGWAIACITVSFMVVGGIVDSLQRVLPNDEWLAIPAAFLSIMLFGIPLLVSLAVLARRLAREAPRDFFIDAMEEPEPTESPESISTILRESREMVKSRAFLLPSLEQRFLAMVAAALFIGSVGFFFHAVGYTELLKNRYSYSPGVQSFDAISPGEVAVSLLRSGTTAILLPAMAWAMWAIAAGLFGRRRPRASDGGAPLASIAAHARVCAVLFLTSLVLALRYIIVDCLPWFSSMEEVAFAGALLFLLWGATTCGAFIAMVHGVACGQWPRCSAIIATLFCIALLVIEIKGWNGTSPGDARTFGHTEFVEVLRLGLMAVFMGSIFVNTIPEARSRRRRPSPPNPPSSVDVSAANHPA